MAILYPLRAGEEEAAMGLLAAIQKLEEDNCAGAVIRRGHVSDVVLFDKEINERREPRVISSAVVSTDGYRCVAQRDENGKILGFDVHGGKKLSVDGATLISAPQLITAAFSLEEDGAKGCINLVATSTVQFHTSSKPDRVFVDDRLIDFTFDEENQLVMFALSSGSHQIAMQKEWR